MAVKELIPNRVADLMRTDGTVYYGPCVVQAPDGWTRIGPTWHVPSHGWIVVGPGVAEWGTSQGLAQLAVSTETKPTFHAAAAAFSPKPVICFSILDSVTDHLGLTEAIEEVGDGAL